MNFLAVTDFLGYPPSTIAAAVVLWATNQSVDNQKLECFHANLNRVGRAMTISELARNIGF